MMQLAAYQDGSVRDCVSFRPVQEQKEEVKLQESNKVVTDNSVVEVKVEEDAEVVQGGENAADSEVVAVSEVIEEEIVDAGVESERI